MFNYLDYKVVNYPNDDISFIFTEQYEIVSTDKLSYYNIPLSFDIETSSFKVQDEKRACMYIWQFGFNGHVILGRTWKDYINFVSQLTEFLQLSSSLRAIVYVHNLGYEFQFMRKWFSWANVFASKERRPIYALDNNNIEYRCSYYLSNYSLAYLGNNLLHKYPLEKMVGDLDYSLIRNSKTELSKKELMYCINDVRILNCYIQEKIETEGDITKIPYTNTGYVRNYCRDKCFYGDVTNEIEKQKSLNKYKTIMKSLKINYDLYKSSKNAFMGGYTHAAFNHVKKILHNVSSADITSSYPFTMCTDLYPMTPFIYHGMCNEEEIEYYCKNFCCIFDVMYKNIRQRENVYESYLSYSHAYVDGKSVINNGRIFTADTVITTITDIDYDIIKNAYVYDIIMINNLWVSERGYLPKNLILSILGLYSSKTKLKGISGKEVEYMTSKNMCNSSYGMMVTDIIRDNYAYNSDWSKESESFARQIALYNTNNNRFLFYPWGIYVTAHARHNLWEGIFALGKDYVYSDTDCCKYLNNHDDFFTNYNTKVLKKIQKVCNFYDISTELFSPKTIKDEEKTLGIWEKEESYEYFKTLGAKRYMYQYQDGTLSLTVSGINKKIAIPYLQSTFGDNYTIMTIFDDGFYIPPGYTGKSTLTYIDNPHIGMLVDYQGNEALYQEKSAIHMEPAGYYMSLAGEYLNFIEDMNVEAY